MSLLPYVLPFPLALTIATICARTVSGRAARRQPSVPVPLAIRPVRGDACLLAGRRAAPGPKSVVQPLRFAISGEGVPFFDWHVFCNLMLVKDLHASLPL